jgi:hypothetical protein
VKYLESVDNSKELCAIPTILSVPWENQKKSVNVKDGMVPRGYYV